MNGWIKIEKGGKEGKEGKKVRRLDGWMVGRLEDWKVGRLEGIYVRSSYFMIVDLIWYGMFV